MSFQQVRNVSIRGVSACVPPLIVENKDIKIYKPGEAEEIIKSTGIERRHVVSDGIVASDLCLKACNELLSQLNWSKESINAICFVTETPDYINHPTGFVLHEKLGLSEDCVVMDLFHGCPGWVMGLLAVSSMMQNGMMKRVLLLVGDSTTTWTYATDRESQPLSGDCGTATALEYDETAHPMSFNLGTRSNDGISIARTKGGERNPWTIETLSQEMKLRSGEIDVKGIADTMDGMNVFSFGITVPPKSIKKLCEFANLDLQTVDKIVLHQANKFIIQQITKKLKVDADKVPTSLRDYGNTTSASIPLTLCSQCREAYINDKMRTIACTFGTGLSWGTVYFETKNIVCPEVITY